MQCLDHSLHSKFALLPTGSIGKREQRGYVMVLSMLMLLVITVISISMAKSFFLEEGMAGNVREKQRALAAAQSALSYGEWYVATHQGYGATCGTGQLANASICTAGVLFNGQNNNSGANPNSALMNNAVPLQTYFNAPTSSYLNTTSGAHDAFYALPGIYIQFVGLDTSNSDYIYKITAYGYGGSQSTVAIVQSTFVTVAAVKNLGGA
jgi:type IV pilus assembly protein PilX